ncbi:hypothetical protein PF008_g21410 [Phytophthora fragariae]|uniref:Necrosis inducing protein NPP1 type n=2 Tax=Phytophthora fragariae TaxID=53985 RepID=A0A6G0QWV1_9STRA|nr:hypothetical protein PF008_g21410 [Phytophthora fragariae]
MNLRSLLATVIAVAGALGSVGGVRIGHDKMQPFAQPEPVIVSEKAAIKFKPNLQIHDGCHPYPAVNAAGETSGGLKGTGDPDGDCKGSPLGSQVYGRASWYKDLWAIMYVWYFPKEQDRTFKGKRHKWTAAVVWLDNPALEKPKILAVSTIGIDGVYKINKSGGEYINGTSIMLAYETGVTTTGLTLATVMDNVESQDLIMWEQMPDAARSGLTGGDFAYPFIDEAFMPNLESARPSF